MPHALRWKALGRRARLAAAKRLEVQADAEQLNAALQADFKAILATIDRAEGQQLHDALEAVSASLPQLESMLDAYCKMCKR